MGIEHPILGLLTFTIIASMLIAAIVLMNIVGMNVQDMILKAPVTEGFASCFSESLRDSRYIYNISLIVANTGRVDLRLDKLFISTDLGVIELSLTSGYWRGSMSIGGVNTDIEVILVGFVNGNELWAGQRGEVRVNMVANGRLYSTGGQYSITGYLKTIGFDAFTVREGRFKPGTLPECQPIIPPPPTVPLDIIRVSRSALYWDDFNTSPINTRMALYQELGDTCQEGYVDSGYGRRGLVYLEIPTRGKECALLVQGLTLPNTGSIYVAFTALIASESASIDQPGLFGAILASLSGSNLGSYYAGGFNESGDRLLVRGKVGAITFASSTSYGVGFNKWYNGTLALSYVLPNVPYAITSYASPTTSTSRILGLNEQFVPPFAGLSINKLTNPKKMRVYFDNILVTHNSPPWVVIVEGLQPGWTVVLRDESGRVIDSKTAPLGGSVELNVWSSWIIRNGSIEVYQGSTLLIARTFTEILGGDVYRVTG